MKILIATDTYLPSVNGAAYFTHRLAQLLARRGHQVFVFAPSTAMKYTVQKDEAGGIFHGIRSIRIPFFKNFWMSPPLIARGLINNLVSEIAPDVIHIQNHFMIGQAVQAIAQKQNIPIMGTNHFMPENLTYYLRLPSFLEKQLRRFSLYQFRSIYRHLSAITAPTVTAANLTNHRELHKVIPISCGIDLDRFNPRNDGGYLRKRYGIPDKKVMLYVGRLDKEKRLDLVLRALPEILRKTDTHLVIAGLGNWEGNLKKIIKNLGIENNVTFTGFVPEEDLSSLYRVADIFIMAGIAELQSIVTMEAMASGLPVIAVNAVALPELVHDGENGYLFEDGDITGFSDKVSMILNDDILRKNMSQKSLEIIQKHDIESIIKRYESVYEGVRSGEMKPMADSHIPRKARMWISVAMAVLIFGISLAILGIYGGSTSLAKEGPRQIVLGVYNKISQSDNFQDVRSALSSLGSRLYKYHSK